MLAEKSTGHEGESIVEPNTLEWEESPVTPKSAQRKNAHESYR